MLATCMVPHLPQASCVALSKSLGFLGPQFLAVVKLGASPHCTKVRGRDVAREMGWEQ